MIKRLRWKFILVTMAVLVIVFTTLFIMLNLYMQNSSSRQTDQLLQMVAEQDGFAQQPQQMEAPNLPDNQLPSFIENKKMMQIGQFFYVRIDEAGNYLSGDFGRMFDFDEQDAMAYVQQVLSQGKEKGTIDNLQYLVANKDYGQIVVFAETSIETQLLSRLINISLWVALATFVLLLIIVFFLSRWMVKPVAQTFRKQRQFISDASHELKTPLTIISANADLLEGELGHNIRLTHIQDQTKRMSGLVHDLLALARNDEDKQKLVMQQVDLSALIKNTALEFESHAFEQNKRYSYDIAENISCLGNSQQLKQLAMILIDNAITHSKDNGEVKVSLKEVNRRPEFSVYNTGEGIAEEERERVFDRFYRADDSRSRESGGYGLGLAIAKAIVDAHQGKIAISGEAGSWVEFKVTL